MQISREKSTLPKFVRKKGSSLRFEEDFRFCPLYKIYQGSRKIAVIIGQEVTLWPFLSPDKGKEFIKLLTEYERYIGNGYNFRVLVERKHF